MNCKLSLLAGLDPFLTVGPYQRSKFVLLADSCSHPGCYPGFGVFSWLDLSHCDDATLIMAVLSLIV